MGFSKPSIQDVYGAVRRMCAEISSPYNDGYTSSSCKHELYLLKCWLEDVYADLPKFTDEADWQKQRLIDKLRGNK